MTATTATTIEGVSLLSKQGGEGSRFAIALSPPRHRGAPARTSRAAHVVVARLAVGDRGVRGLRPLDAARERRRHTAGRAGLEPRGPRAGHARRDVGPGRLRRRRKRNRSVGHRAQRQDGASDGGSRNPTAIRTGGPCRAGTRNDSPGDPNPAGPLSRSGPRSAPGRAAASAPAAVAAARAGNRWSWSCCSARWPPP